MAPPHKVKVVEQCRVSPSPPPSAARPSLPLTFFDLVFLPFPPVQRLFFYDYPYPKSHFLDSQLPALKSSLSLTLHHYYPFAGTLTPLSTSQPPEIQFSEPDSVRLTVATSNGDFCFLSSNRARDVTSFHPLLPPLLSSAVLAVQLTVFPNSGIVVGTTLHHAIADGSTYTRFIKAWASISKFGEADAMELIQPLPSYDRGVIRDPKGLEATFLGDLRSLKADRSLEAWDLHGRPGLVQATFVLGRDQLSRLGSNTLSRCSSYALACGYVWSCLVRARGETSKKREHFGFVTGCRPRLTPPAPASYFGNCLGICLVEAKHEDLVAADGPSAAAEAIWRVITGLEEGAFERAEEWVKDVFSYASKRALTVAGSPKLGIYEVDFGWGKPRKVEMASIERTGALALAESREKPGGIEVGLALPCHEMEEFISAFYDGLPVTGAGRF